MIKLIPAFLLVVVFLTGCRQVIRPQVEELAGINSFQDGCYELDISVDLIDDDLVMYYLTKVIADCDSAKWEGTATVYWSGAYFKQECHTLYQEGDSYKAWRDGWVVTDMKSPLDQILQWQEHMVAGEGKLTRNAVPASEYGDILAGIPGKVYLVTLEDQDFDWRSLCDVDLDSLFGTNERLDVFDKADVRLYYSAEDWSLSAIQLEYISDADYLAATISVAPTENTLDFTLDELDAKDGYLSEEWSMPGMTE